MALPDLEELLQPISEDSPTGENLEYDQEFSDLERIAQGTPDRVIRVKDPENPEQEIDQVVPGEEADPREVQSLCESLFKRTRDLRVGMYFARAATRLEGLQGYVWGLSLISGLLSRYWAPLHPQMEPDELREPILRNNTLAGLADPGAMLRTLRGAPLVESREVGRFLVRDVEVADGTLSPLDGQMQATPELINAAMRSADQEAIAARMQASVDAVARLDEIERAFRENDALGPDLSPVKKLLRGVEHTYAKVLRQESAEAESAEAGEGGEAGGGAGEGEAVRSGKLRNRGDVRMVLEQVCDFLERTEPANPAPLLIRRAIRILDMSFLDIIRDVAPDSIAQVEGLGGLSGLSQE